MNLPFIKLLIWAVATMEISGEARQDHNSERERIDISASQKDIISGGIFENDNYTPRKDREIGLGYVGNQHHGNNEKERHADRSYKNELTKMPTRYLLQNRRNDNYVGNRNSIYNIENGWYHGSSGIFQEGATRGVGKERNTLTIHNRVVPNPQHYPLTINTPIPISRRVIVPVPSKTQVEVPIPPAVDASYHVYPSLYSPKIPVHVPAAAPAKASVLKSYTLVNDPQLFFLNNEYGNRLEINGRSRKIISNSNAPAINEGSIKYRQQANYDTGYTSSSDFNSLNSLCLRGIQKPILESNFRNSHSYYTYSTPSAFRNSGIYGIRPTSLLTRKLKKPSAYISNNTNSINGNGNKSSRYSFSTSNGYLSQGDTLNKNKHFNGFKAPTKNYVRYPHREIDYSIEIIELN